MISGSGSVIQAGTGTTILTGDSSYTGGTTISAGTLQLGDGGTTGSILGDVADNGTLAFDRSDTVAFPGVISGSGGAGPDRPGHHHADRRQHLHGRHDDQRRHAAARQWRDLRQHRRQRRRQRSAGLRPQRHGEFPGGDFRRRRPGADRRRHHDPDRRQHLYRAARRSAPARCSWAMAALPAASSATSPTAAPWPLTAAIR